MNNPWESVIEVLVAGAIALAFYGLFHLVSG